MIPAIKVEGLWKEYIVGSAQERHTTFYDVLSSAIRAPFRSLRRLRGQADEADRFWALRDVSFEVQPGEVLGVIGRNGAGKSTLLKILSRITAPTRGRIEVRGRLASLLEVGTGFHPELSGRENIYLNGAILGMTRSEITRKFDEIVAFAEIEKFVDTPVKRYSSGMYVRLAFAVAAHLDADILLVDEVLAVGDAEFQKRCLGKMKEVSKSGRTVLFVSHNLAAVRNLCQHALVFDQGRLSFDGWVREGVSYYERLFASPTGVLAHAHFHGPLSQYLRFDALICKQDGQVVNIIDPLKDFEIEIRGVSFDFFPRLELKLGIFQDGFHIASCHDTPSEAPMQRGAFASCFHIRGDVFRPGRYTVGIGAVSSMGSWTWGSDLALLDFSDNLGNRSSERSEGAVSVPYVGKRLQ